MNAYPGKTVLKSQVLDHYCKLAVETDYVDIRKVLLDVLKCMADEANKRFISYAQRGTDPAVRRRALINLGLMKCQSAKDVVLQGLKDPSREVRVAAAFCAGFYHDQEIMTALKNFFAVHRFDELS